jgi:predicted amidohydrolase YtcJ
VTPRELTEAAPDVPVFVLFLYSRGFLNRAGVQALGITSDSQPPEGGRYEITEDGGAILHAEPNPTILYQTISRLPGMSADDQVLSTQHFYRELNRFGITSAVDAGGGGHVFPEDYVGSRRLAERGALPVRVSSFLVPQVPGKELESFQTWTKTWSVNQNLAKGLENGFVIEGGGEFLAWSAGDYENFTAARPDITQRPGWPEELTAVTRHLLQVRWPFRIHATYDESIGHILDVFELVHREERAAGRPGFDGVRWAIDHAETVSVPNLRRIGALGGGVAVQARMAFAGEFFAERYGKEAASNAPPLRDILELGLPLAAGTDATRVASYNPWVALAWLVTGRTVGGAELRAERHQLGRLEALQLYTVGSAWLSGEEARKGRLAVGQYADLAVLSKDYLSVPEAEIASIESLLTVTAGRIVHAAGPFAEHAPPLPELAPTWSPVGRFGGYANDADGGTR